MTNTFNREEAVAAGASFEYYPVFVYECAVNAFRAALSEAGLNRVMESSRHYNEAWGRTVIGMVKERFGRRESDLETLAMTEYYVHCCTSFGHIKPLEIREGGAICELYACPNPGLKAPPEMCVAMSHVMGEAYCRAVNPRYEFVFTNHLANGDDCCRWVVRKKGSEFPLDDLGRLEKTIPCELSIGEMQSFAGRMVVFGMLFTFTTVCNDLMGSQRTLELVEPLARETGIRLGTRLKMEAGGKGDFSTIRNATDMLGFVLRQTGAPMPTPNSGIEKEITDCPCKGAPPEVCKQLEGVFRGVCEAINPSYDFAYDRMMSKGDSTCHWVIRKKDSAVEKPKEEAARFVRI